MPIPGTPTSPLATGNLALAGASGFLSTPFSLRTIGSIKADVTFEERHEDSLTITDHPVEQGASITDHAFLNPVSVEIKVGFKPKTGLLMAANFLTSGGVPYLNQVYQNVLNLQKSRVLNVVMTGKRLYTNMLVERITCVTDRDTENVLRLTISCRQAIIVQTQAVTFAPNSSMSAPQKTGSVQNLGQKSLVPAS
ncbi:MAG: hypothetical protein VST70_01690 [Nitrospirota bacterium]|nr:hypothetical protein [Nitrospirota bacterium]